MLIRDVLPIATSLFILVRAIPELKRGIQPNAALFEAMLAGVSALCIAFGYWALGMVVLVAALAIEAFMLIRLALWNMRQNPVAGSAIAPVVVSRMHGLDVMPAARQPGDYRSELLVVGRCDPDGRFVIYRRLVYRNVFAGTWVDDKTDKPIDMDVTHWIEAREQAKVFG